MNMDRENKSRKTSRAGDEKPKPVLVVPGWGAPPVQTNWVCRRLEAGGFEAVGLGMPRLATGDIRDSAKFLSEEVSRFIPEAECGSVNLLGFSLGGLIARVYLSEFGGLSTVHRAVFVGAPQDRVYIAYLGVFTKSARQLLPGSRFLEDLEEAGPCGCPEPRCLSIYLTKDGTILPSESAHLRCGYNLRLKWPVSHWGLVFNKKVLATAARFMKGEIPPGAELAGD
jgi:triacylglycerol lipase